MHKGFWWGCLREIDYLEDPCKDGRIILKCIFRKWDGRAQTGLIWTGTGTGDGTRVCRYEPTGFIKCGEYLDWVRIC